MAVMPQAIGGGLIVGVIMAAAYGALGTGWA